MATDSEAPSPEITDGESLSPPRLPNELAKIVLQQLENDKPTLSACMRVSVSWNALTAPILYHLIKYDFPQTHTIDMEAEYPANPFWVRPKSVKRVEGCRGLSKEQCLRYVRHIMFAEHWGDSCWFDLNFIVQAGLEKMSLDTIRLCFDHDDNEHEPHWERGICFAGDVATTKRVVLANTSCQFAASPFPADTIISIFRPEQDDLQNPSFEHNRPDQHSCRHAIYIYYSTGPYYHRNQLDSNGAPGMYTSFLGFQFRLVKDAWYQPQTKEVTIVNIDCLAYADPRPTNRADLKGFLQNAVDAQKPKNADKDAQFKLDFWTMEEFLQRCDWTGVFEESEVGHWL